MTLFYKIPLAQTWLFEAVGHVPRTCRFTLLRTARGAVPTNGFHTLRYNASQVAPGQAPHLPLSKGGKTPLFYKEGTGEIFRCMSIQF